MTEPPGIRVVYGRLATAGSDRPRRSRVESRAHPEHKL